MSLSILSFLPCKRWSYNIVTVTFKRRKRWRVTALSPSSSNVASDTHHRRNSSISRHYQQYYRRPFQLLLSQLSSNVESTSHVAWSVHLTLSLSSSGVASVSLLAVADYSRWCFRYCCHHLIYLFLSYLCSADFPYKV